MAISRLLAAEDPDPAVWILQQSTKPKGVSPSGPGFLCASLGPAHLVSVIVSEEPFVASGRKGSRALFRNVPEVLQAIHEGLCADAVFLCERM